VHVRTQQDIAVWVQIARRPIRQLREETALAEDVKETTAARGANFQWVVKLGTRVCEKTCRRRSIESTLRGSFYVRATSIRSCLFAGRYENERCLEKCTIASTRLLVEFGRLGLCIR
jgi:hypothetical protein